jgi:hypothetical protein
MGFIESYKRLDNLCKDLFKSETGVTTYINNMEYLTNARYQIGNWDSDYKQLKHFRYIRNQIVHENNVTEGNICNKNDILWIEQFHQRILQRTDPLALYHKAVTASQQKTTQYQKPSKSIWAKISSLFRRNK